MGWLRDLMQAADPPVRSFGKLANAALSSGDWPADYSIQPRSLATLLSRLDRGLELQWLAERPPSQVALARILRVSPDEIQSALGEPQRPEPRALKLTALPAARPIDLALEALPPGIPSILQRHLEQATFWVAPSGSGRSLLGKWLEARGRATFLEGGSWDALEKHASDGPLFIELTESNPRRLPKPRPGLCVAAAGEPPENSGYLVVRSPEVAEVLRPLLLWAAERLPKETLFDAETAESVFREKIDSGWLDSLGSVLGAIGLVDEFGLRQFSARSEDRIAKRFVEANVTRTLSASLPYASWVRRSIYSALVAMIERALVDSDTALHEPQSFDAWLELVPPELERHVDLEWMRLSLSRMDSGVRASDVERAARRLPPGAFRIVTTLEQARILRRVTDGRLKLDPPWLVSALRRVSIDALLKRSAFEWGEALLRPHAAAEVAEALLTRTLAEGGSTLSSVLDLEAEDQPAYAAAVDAALRVAGMARLLGHDLGVELFEGLLAETEALAVDFGNGLLEPRIALAPPGTPRALRSSGRALLSPGTFYLALLSVSEILEHGALSRLRTLLPWQRTDATIELKRAYDAIEASLQIDPPWRHAAFSLIARVRSVVGNVDGADTPHPLELPAQALEEIEHGVLSFSTVQRAGASSMWLEALWNVAKQRQVDRSEVSRAIWMAWDREGRPNGADFLSPDAAENVVFWSNIPGALLESLLSNSKALRPPFEAFGDEQWFAFFSALSRVPHLVEDPRAFERLPENLVPQTLGLKLDWSRAKASLEVLWHRFPELLSAELFSQIERAARGDSGALDAFLSTAPESVTAHVLAKLQEESLGHAPAALVAIRAMLRRIISGRGSSWRLAYRKLSDLERELRRTQRSSPSSVDEVT